MVKKPTDVSSGRQNTNNDGAEIRLQPPWGDSQNVIRGDSNVSRYANVATKIDPETARAFIRMRTEAHVKFTEQTETTKRLGYGLSAILLVVALIIPVFAPQGRETISWITSACLALFSAGAFGYSSIKIRALRQSVDAGRK